MNYKILYVIIAIIFFIAGCSQEKEVIKNEENNSTSAENRNDSIQKPPNLKVSVNGEAFMAASYGYSWSYYDEEEKSMASISAEVVPVSDLIGNRKGPAVNSDTTIELKFEEEPISYEVFVLGSFPSNRGTDVVLDKQSGRTIYEVNATWEQGTGSYVFPLTIE
ncbi:hypothetical protein [Planococcus salinarum]|uniref:hypothetical protein n=1 Tax=Planococcus salinarum TaxID=622695 RepID=UPI000E3C3181|nr:hypothetical protein [Planococcus salinarum]TAA66097.1 hypothetical protein D2909_15625 [Planococcus salinarum]